MTESRESYDLPRAGVGRGRAWPWLWLLPLAAASLSLWLLFSAWGEKGIGIEVELPHGHGLEVGDLVRYRGIAVGSVQELELTPDLGAVRAWVVLESSARELSREGSRFWVVRPQVDFAGASGLNTLIGAKYLGATPGSGPYRKRFQGLDQPPPMALLEAGGLELTLVTPDQGGIRAGAPVSYRRVVIGKILDVDLARDASAVELRIYIQPRYSDLMREGTRFWKVGGAQFRAGFTGIELDVEPVGSLLLGGVTLAIPPNPGPLLAPGQRLPLHERPEPEWLQWVPFLALKSGPDQVEPGRPRPLALELSWQYKEYWAWTRDGRRRGWGLPLAEGLLAPADLLQPPPEALPGSAALSAGERELSPGPVRPLTPDLALLPAEHQWPVWTLGPGASLERAEDLLIIADPERPRRFVAAEHLRRADGAWRIADLPFDPDWHGASVVADGDGRLLGLLLVDAGGARIAQLGVGRGNQEQQTEANATAASRGMPQ
jgi:hypothetical protein